MAHDDYDDDLDETADSDDDETGEEEVNQEAENAEANTPEAGSGGGEGTVARGDVDEAESLTVSSKEALRRQLEEEMERFLAKGGKIQEIPPDPTADPQHKPD